MTRKIPLAAFAAAQCILTSLVASVPAQAAEIPKYFFSQWTVTANCTEANAGPAARVQTGLKFQIVSPSTTDGTYTLQALNAAGRQWTGGWNGLKLEYRAGTKMTTVPADFACAAGSEASSASSSPLLAMSGYVQSAEPYYEQQHWYGLAKIHGQLEHVLIFPRDTRGGGASAIIVLESASANSDIKLDDDGVINAD